MRARKSLIRIHYSGGLAPGASCVLPPQPSRHVAAALRLRAGDEIVLFDGAGAEYPGTLARVAEGRVVVRVGEPRAVSRESPLAVTLAQSVSAGERMDFTVQKAVELGVARIQPLSSRRGVVRLDGERAAKRVAHWQAVAVAACEQCGRNRVPAVEPLRPLTEWLRRDAAARGEEAKLMLSPRAGTGVRRLARPTAGVLLLAGPEGGFSAEEERAALEAGFQGVRLGPRVLRTETAAVAALAALQALWGDF